MSQFLLPLALTLMLELPVAFLWGLRGKNILLCILVNILTNPLANLIHLFFPFAWVTLAIECAVVGGEGLCYKACGDEIKRPVLLSFAANALSFLVGWLILAYL